MNRLCTCLVLAASVSAAAQQAPSAQSADVMLAAVSRDESMLIGGMQSSSSTRRGTVVVEPLAYITPTGEWKSIPCMGPRACKKFERNYLSKPQTYTVVSGEGTGATIKAAPTTLDECYGFTGTGTYSGAPIQGNAIAASSPDLFGDAVTPQLLAGKAAHSVRAALTGLLRGDASAVQQLQLFRVQLEGQHLVIVQRAFVVGAPVQVDEVTQFVFFVGTRNRGRFRVLHRLRESEGEERVLGTIRLKTGREFLVTALSDEESQSFHVYGLRDGRFTMIYSGGGYGC